MLQDFRKWLKSELDLLGNASHHAYAFGQANMAQRAIEEFDKELAATLYVPLDRATVRRALTELQLVSERTTALGPGMRELRGALQAALDEARPPVDEGV